MRLFLLPSRYGSARLVRAVLLLAASLAVTAGPLRVARAASRHVVRSGQAVTASAVRATPGSKAFNVAVLGDGFGEALAEGLKMNFADRPDVAILAKTHAPFGLSQDAMFQWTIMVKNIFAGPDHVDAAVIMLGADDTQPLKDGQITVAPGTARWNQLYGDRVEAIAALFRDKRIPLTWVGLPVVEDEALSADFVALNQTIRDRAVKAGASYIDSWDAFVDEAGKYSQVGPDINGQMAKLRTADGLDFTRAGERKLASFVESDIRQDREKAAPPASDPSAVLIQNQPEFDNALNVDISAQIRREAGLPALQSSLPERDAGRAPQIGPLITVTAPALALDGRLDERRGPALADIGGTAVRRALVEGQPIQPKPGRTDDFSWPRP